MTDLPPNGPSRPPSGPPPGGTGGAPAPGYGPGPRPGGPPAGGLPPGNGPGPIGWYSGPVPFTALVARDTVGRAVGRTVAKTLAALGTLAVGGFVVIIAFAVLVAGLSGTSSTKDALPTKFVAGDKGNANTLLAIPISGIILGENEGGGGLFAALQSATYGYDVKKDLEEAAKREDIKGVVLEMDTPGGTIFGSRAINEAVTAYRKATGRPVLAYVRGLAASGGMYAMAGADHIVADHGTLIGSIGVIFGPLTHYDHVVGTDGGVLGGGVQTTGGITQDYITAGRSKDLGNPYRPMTDEERKVLQTGVDNSYGEFVDAVAAGRSIDAATIRGDLGALIYDEQTAVQKKLVDEIGNRDVAYAKAAELAKLAPGNWEVARLDRNGGGLFGLGARFGAAFDALSGRSPSTGNRATSGNPANGAATATGATLSVRDYLCGRGPTMLAFYGDLPTSCG